MRFLQKTRKLVTVLVMAAMLIGLPGVCSLRVSAAGGVTFAVKYVPSLKEWRYQYNTSSFDDKASSKSISVLSSELRSGDLVVVYNDSDSVPELKLGTTHLSNLTVTNCNSFTIIFSGSVEDCYLLGGASCAINANVTNAYVYDTVLGNFNMNVQNLYIYPEKDLTSTLGCGGTVGYMEATSRTTDRTFYRLYDFQAASFAMKDGVLTTDQSRYSQSPKAPQAPQKPLTADNFDYVRYANDYPDVKAALGLNAAALYGHYITYGIKEGRIAYAVTGASAGTGAGTGEATSASEFNYIRYADKNPDLKAAFGYDAKALYKHYTTFGISENRGSYSIYDTFDYTRYADDYADLKASFGYDAKALYRHYATYGISEGRGNYFK